MPIWEKIEKIPRWLQIILVAVVILLAVTLILKFGGWFDKVAAVYVTTGDAALTEENYSEALQQYSYAISLEHLDGQSAYDAYLKRGRIFIRKRDYESAIADLEKATKLSRRWPEAYFYLGQAYSGVHDYVAAEEALESALKYNNEDAVTMVELSQAVLRNGKELDRAEDLLKQAISLDEGYQPAYFYLSLLLLERDPDEALAMIDKALDTSGAMLAESQVVHERLLDFQERVKDRGDDNESQAYKLVLVGWTYASVNEHAAAGRLADEALVISPEYRDAWELLAWSQIGLGQYPEASDSLTTAYNLDPTSGQTQYLFAKAEVGEGKLDSARESFALALSLGYDHRSLRLDYARLLHELGDDAVAEEQYRKALSMNRQDLVVAAEVVWFLGNIQDKGSEALEIARSLDKSVNSPQAQAILALANFYADDRALAAELAGEVIFQEPSLALAYYVRGLVTGSGDDFIKAIDADLEGTIGKWAEQELAN